MSRSAGRARDFTTATLVEWRLAATLVQDVVLAVSELVSNAVEHGRGEVIVELGILPGRCLRVRVRDEDTEGVPASAQPSPVSPRSRGLAIVEALGAAWGYRADTAGKWVWADFSLGGSHGAAV